MDLIILLNYLYNTLSPLKKTYKKNLEMYREDRIESIIIKMQSPNFNENELIEIENSIASCKEKILELRRIKQEILLSILCGGDSFLKNYVNRINEELPKCCICFETTLSKLDKTLCNHPICKQCLIKSFKTNYKTDGADVHFLCPVCRNEIIRVNYAPFEIFLASGNPTTEPVASLCAITLSASSPLSQYIPPFESETAINLPPKSSLNKVAA